MSCSRFWLVLRQEILNGIGPGRRAEIPYFLTIALFHLFQLGSGQNLPANHPGSRVGGHWVFWHRSLGGQWLFLKQQMGGQTLFLEYILGGLTFFLGFFSGHFSETPIFWHFLMKIGPITNLVKCPPPPPPPPGPRAQMAKKKKLQGWTRTDLRKVIFQAYSIYFIFTIVPSKYS